MTLRLARSDDADRILEMMSAFYAESDMPLDRGQARAALATLTADPALGRLWTIQPGNALAGYIAVTFGFSLEYLGRDAFIDDFYIEPPHRGRGLGNSVLEIVESECRALGVRALHLEVGRGNAAGQSLYRKRGFRDNDRQLLSLRLGPESRDASRQDASAKKR
ncbi:MAG: GNAT family N-acetyltransferase [Deltaproteobacteria bacterium]|nr:GNAT family N-acetyltransferase [Deltaproteobacteria bacterium]